MPITLDGVNLANASAPLIFQTCKFPILDLRRYRRPDEVVQNMPTFIGGWANGTIAPAIETQVVDIDTEVNVDDDCHFPVVSVALTGCDWIAPDQKVLAIQSDQINWKNLVTRYCTSANIALDRIGQIFNRDGSVVSGNPYTLNIVRFATQAVANALGLSLTHSAMRGDAANTNQFDGLYTQIDNGWENGNDACAATLNTGQVINWDLLTGGDGSGTANPDEKTVATTITLWGQSFNVPADLTLGDFLAYYIDAAEANFARGENVVWEMHAPIGWRMNVLRALSCINICNSTNILSQYLIERYEQLVSGKTAELFGYGITFPILETDYAGANTLRFGPREIGGLPTYGLVFENIAQVLRELSPIGEALVGSGQGHFVGNEPLLAMTREQIQIQFESLTVHRDFEKVSAVCVIASELLKAGLLATNRNMWLQITNVGAVSFCLPPPEDFTVNNIPVTSNPPPAPALVTPANASSASDTTPTYTWAAVTGATEYQIQVSTVNTFASTVEDEVVAAPTVTFTASTLTTGVKYWRVRANSLSGFSPWSVVRSHTIT